MTDVADRLPASPTRAASTTRRRRGSPHPSLRALLAIALLASLVNLAAAESPIRQVEVARSGDAYLVDAVIYAPVPPTIAWSVLTDFDHMADWVPNVRSSRVVARNGEIATVEQHGVVRAGLFRFPYASLRAIDTSAPLTIRSRQLEGSMRRFDSTMRLAAERDGTRLAYHVEIVPGLLAAGLLTETMVEREIGEQFTAIVAEMRRRRP